MQSLRVAGVRNACRQSRTVVANTTRQHVSAQPTPMPGGRTFSSFPLASSLGSYPDVTLRGVSKSQTVNSDLIRRIVTRGIRTTSIVNGKRIVSFNLADIGEAIAEVELVQWYVEEGDVVEQFDQICLVESDKASVPITSRYDGKIVKLYYEEGDMAATGLPLLDIEVDEEGLDEYDTASEASVDVEAPGSFSTAVESDDESANNDSNNESNTKYIMTPAVRRIVREHNVDLAQVTPTGKNNRVLKSDVILFLEGQQTPQQQPTQQQHHELEQSNFLGSPQQPQPQQPQQQAPPPVTLPPMRTLSPLTEDKIVPITGMQKAMVKSMNAANQVPHFGYSDECVVDGLVEIRNQLKQAAADRGIKLSYMPFMIKAVSLALTDFPILNAHVNAECDAVTYKASHNIALAMDTPNGLVVPNVKNCEQKSVFEIAADLNQLQTLGASGQLGVAHLSGGTFSLSNIGVVGGTYLDPVLLVPQVAIGALGSIRKLPRYDENDNLVPQQIMNVSWSADHRVIDGVTMAKFSNQWKAYLANPALMLADLR